MSPRPDSLLQRGIDRLLELPFVEEAHLVPQSGGRGKVPDGLLRIVTPTTTEEYVVEAKRTHLTRTLVEGVLAQMNRLGRRPWILFAPHIGRPLAQYLEDQGVNFVDLAGNCRLQIGSQHLAKIEGRPPERRPRQGRGVGAPGHQVHFALLVRPALLNAPVRTLAEAAGVAASTAADRIAQLRQDGLVHETNQGRRLTEPRRLLDLWLKGYETLVRPKLLMGRYRAQETDPEALERLIEDLLDDEVAWAFGGGAAAYRLAGYYRGSETVVHVEQGGFDVAKRLRLLRADDGLVIVVGAPGPLAFEGAEPRTVAPLLVYSELLAAGEKRAREAAAEIHRKYLEALA
jgi:hypothetical protein